MIPPEKYLSRNIESLRGRKLILGLSGGADSVALFRLLLACHADFECAHCNFMLRGEESMRDENFVTELCKSFNVTLHKIRFNVAERIDQHPVESTEMACRELRYGWWRELLKERDAELIVLGHHADDNVETMLINLFRGSGPAGLAGMPRQTELAVRPLYDCSRKEILDYLASIGQDYIVDSTNLESDYRRNFIRNQLLPLIETQWPGVRKALRSTARFMREEHRIVTQCLNDLSPAGSNFLSLETIESFPSKETLLHHFLSPSKPSSSQIMEIIRCVDKGNLAGKKWITPDYRIDGEKKGLYLTPIIEENHPIPEYTVLKYTLDAELLETIRSMEGHDMAWMAYDPEKYLIRKFKAGDRVYPLGMKGSRLLSDIMKEANLTAVERINTIVFEDPSTGRIIWVPGLVRSRFDLILPSTPYAWLIFASDINNSKE